MVIMLAQYNEFVCDNVTQMISKIDCDDDSTREIVTEIMQIVTNTCKDKQVWLWPWLCKQVFWSQQCLQTSSLIATMCTNKQAVQRQLAHKCTIATMFMRANDCDDARVSKRLQWFQARTLTLSQQMINDIDCIDVCKSKQSRNQLHQSHQEFFVCGKVQGYLYSQSQKSLLCLDRLNN